MPMERRVDICAYYVADNFQDPNLGLNSALQLWLVRGQWMMAVLLAR